MGVPVGPTLMEQFRKDKRFLDSLEFMKDFLQSHVWHFRNWLRIEAGVLCLMRVPHALPPEMSWVATDVACHERDVSASALEFSLCSKCFVGPLMRLSRARLGRGVPLQGRVAVHSIGA